MRMILELDTDEELTTVAKRMPWLTLSVKRTRTLDHQNRIPEFLQFIDRETIPVETVTIPSREERNAR